MAFARACLSVAIAVSILVFSQVAWAKVAIIVDGPAPQLTQAVSALATEVNAVEGAGTMPEVATHVGDFTLARVGELFAAAFADPQVELVVGIGTLTGLHAGAAATLPKPVVIPYAAPAFQSLPRKGEVSGKPNLGYVAGVLTIERDMARFHDIVAIDEIVVLTDQYIVDALPLLRAKRDWTFGPVRAHVLAVGPTAAEALAAIPADARAVYLGPVPRLDAKGRAELIEGINARKLPTYAGGTDGHEWVELGAFTTLEPPDDVTRRLRQAALLIADGLRGQKLAEASTVFVPRAELAINVATSRSIGISPTFEVLTEAEIVGREQVRKRGEELSIRSAVDVALVQNLDLQAERASIDGTRAQLRQAWASVLPTLSASADWTWLDPDAASPFGNAEHSLKWGLSAQQIIYSPNVPAAISASKAAVRAADAGLDSARLDLVSETITAYVNVLRAANAERIHQQNLKNTRSHLALSEVRVEIGATGRQEILRWQAQIADDRKKVIQASATRNQAEIQLNRLMGRPLEESFSASEPGPDELGLVSGIGSFVKDPWSFKRLRAFMVEEAFDNSADIQQLEAAIEVQQAVQRGQKHRLFTPDVVLGAGLSHTFLRAGEGSEEPASAPGLPLTAPDEFVWQIGVSLQFALFDYTRYAQLDETRAAILELETQRDSVRQRIEQGVRSALHQAGASSASVRLSQQAADAAQANLALVADGYRTGVLGIVQLIDAQNQARVTQLAASDARYDFLLDFIQVERAAGSFSLLDDEAERANTLKRLNEFMSKSEGSAFTEE